MVQCFFLLAGEGRFRQSVWCFRANDYLARLFQFWRDLIIFMASFLSSCGCAVGTRRVLLFRDDDVV